MRVNRSIGLRRLHAIVVMALVVTTTIVACGGGGTVTPTPTNPPTTVPTPNQSITVKPVVWTTGVDPQSGEPVDRIEAFPRDTPIIYAAFEVSKLPAGGTLTARWSINGHPVDALATTIRAEQDRPAGWAEFDLVWNGQILWPVGTLTIVITSSTGDGVKSSVEIA